MTKSFDIIAISILSSFILTGLSLAPEFVAVAHAETCASEAVRAQGEESRFVWMAKTKARANWRAKVRAKTGLGPDFADWARAENTEERCLTGPKGTVCTFTGTPCQR